MLFVMILRPKFLSRHPGSLPGATTATSAVLVPTWLRRAVPDAQGVAGKDIETPSTVVVIFSPNTAPLKAMAAVSSVEGRLVWTDSSDRVWAIELPEGARTAKLYKYGAIFVSSSVLPISCLRWSRAYG
jgi:hypothetical protein